MNPNVLGLGYRLASLPFITLRFNILLLRTFPELFWMNCSIPSLFGLIVISQKIFNGLLVI